MQNLEAHAVPLPLLTRETTLTSSSQGEHWIRLGQRCRDPIYRHCLQHRQQPAAMVDVVMTDDDAVQARDPRGTQERHHDPAAAVSIAGIGWPGVIEQRMIGGANHRGQPLADVQHIDPDLRCAWSLRRDREQREEADKPEPACGKAPRSQQPQHAQHRHRDCPNSRCVLLPYGGRQPAQCLQSQITQQHELGGQDQQQVPGQHQSQQSERDDHQADQRNGHRIGDGRNNRDLLEQHDQQRHEADRDRPLDTRPVLQPSRREPTARG